MSVCVRESVCVCARARGMYQRNAGELAVLVVEFQISGRWGMERRVSISKNKIVYFTSILFFFGLRFPKK